MKNNLAKIVERIEEAQKLATFDLTEWDSRTRPGKELQKRQAQERLKELEENYNSELPKSIVKVFLNTNAEETAQLVNFLKTKEIEAIVAPSVYDFITVRVEPALRRDRVFDSGAYIKTIEATSEAARGIRNWVLNKEFTEPTHQSVPTKQNLLDVVKGVVRTSFGDSLNAEYVFKNIKENCLSTRFCGDYLVVLITDVLSQEELQNMANSLFPNQPSVTMELAQSEKKDLFTRSDAVEVIGNDLIEKLNQLKSKKKK